MIDALKIFIKYILGFLLIHGWEVTLVMVVVYTVFGNKIKAKHSNKKVREILKSFIPDVNKEIEEKVIEIKYEKTVEEILESQNRMCMYGGLAIIGLGQSIYTYYIVHTVDLVTYQLALFTVVIAVLETKNNLTLRKDRKIELDEKNSLLIDFQATSSENSIKQMVNKYMEEQKKLTEFEKMYNYFKNRHNRVVKIKSIYGKNKDFKASIQSGEDSSGKYISITIKEKIKYLPKKIREGKELQVSSDRKKYILVYKVATENKAIQIEIPF